MGSGTSSRVEGTCDMWRGGRRLVITSANIGRTQPSGHMRRVGAG
jgi:hypothetical protein